MALGLSVVATVFVYGLAARGGDGLRPSVPQSDSKTSRITLSVRDARPLAKAILTLEAQYGCIITYEDPRYAYPDDIADVTEQVRRDLDKYPPGRAPKVLVPKGGELTFQYDANSQLSSPLDPAVVVRQLLAVQAASPNAGTFRMEKGENIIHVIPTAIKDRSGKPRPNKSVLDALITLPDKERTGLQTLEDLCAAIGRTMQVRVIVGTIPEGLFLRHKDKYGVTDQKARNVLIHLFEATGQGRRLSWQMFYGPGTKMYVLNIHTV